VTVQRAEPQVSPYPGVLSGCHLLLSLHRLRLQPGRVARV